MLAAIFPPPSPVSPAMLPTTERDEYGNLLWVRAVNAEQQYPLFIKRKEKFYAASLAGSLRCASIRDNALSLYDNLKELVDALDNTAKTAACTDADIEAMIRYGVAESNARLTLARSWSPE